MVTNFSEKESRTFDRKFLFSSCALAPGISLEDSSPSTSSNSAIPSPYFIIAQQDKRTPEYRTSKAFREYKKYYNSLDGESTSSENTKSSRTETASSPSEPARAFPTRDRLDSRRSRIVRFEPLPGNKPADTMTIQDELEDRSIN